MIKVIDGDTIKVQLGSGPINVRFHSIDAPEKDQPWGAESSAALAGRLSGKVVDLDVVTQDRYERLVAEVYLGNDNIGAWMVKEGQAWAYRDYLRDQDYCVWEGAARATRRGLWGLPPDSRHAPWEWRSSKRGQLAHFSDYANESVANCIAHMNQATRTAEPTAPQAMPHTLPPVLGNCRIKGNISDNGRIYHMPGSPSYDRTLIDESRGERWFCSEKEAVEAGWRPPRN